MVDFIIVASFAHDTLEDTLPYHVPVSYLFLYKSGMDIEFQGVEAPRIYRQLVHEDDKFGGPMHSSPFTPKKYSRYLFLLGAK